MNRAVDAVFDRAVQQLDRELRRLVSMSRTKSGIGAATSVFDHDGFAAISRAMSYVVMGGVLEAMMRELPRALASDISALNIERRHLPVSLIAAIESAVFRQCSNDNVASLITRTNIVRQVMSHTVDSRPVVDFGDLFKLADGQTINEKHFRALWVLLDLDGDWWNDQNDSMLLNEIRSKRNDVAHWEDDPVEIGRSKQASDLQKMVVRLSNLVQHFQLCIWYWLDERANAVT